ncbi:hypothetical protein FTUN_6640 [Frigoriglobus tundricola]|uniref:Uncharacterized protein n=1 Tax=Frigoriglobus tundricola TaxID=2774151 RepID=A0A6M5Z1J1_9BACT|nr:hypothetical protein FTUN_6640 [Frigoriglobus tundricola]
MRLTPLANDVPLIARSQPYCFKDYSQSLRTGFTRLWSTLAPAWPNGAHCWPARATLPSAGNGVATGTVFWFGFRRAMNRPPSVRRANSCRRPVHPPHRANERRSTHLRAG